MELATTRSLHPLTALAAVSVTVFSLAGIAAIAGWIPTSHSQSAQIQSQTPAEESLKAAAATQASAVTAATRAAEPKPATSKIVKHAKAQPKPAPAVEVPAAAPRDETPAKVAQSAPPAGYGPPPETTRAPEVAAPKPACHDCGVIESVREIEKAGEGSGVGAVAGGVAGGVLGRQTGGGRGKDLMTVLGAIGGAVAGNAIEKNVKKIKVYEVSIRFDDGSSRLLTQNTPPAWHSGERVRLVDGVITSAKS